ncbi:hypothetical protein [Microbacterium indicum]|uniref:hypothetical protein n=1 Tax=Microbacterium indicum TaxID=358100 RepID=UPI000409B808|nr:hypothetical protein [Microbacterium indicum]
MTDERETRLAGDIAEAVREVPGVTALYSPGGAASQLVDAGARALGVRAADAAPVRVERDRDGTRVEVAIGAHAAHGGAATARRVHAAVRALCDARGAGPSIVRVTVVHVDDGRPGDQAAERAL